MKNILFIFIISCIVQNVFAQSIDATGEWNYTIPTNDITEAGEDFTGIYESSVNQTYVDIENTNKWDVLVQKIDIDWDNTFNLFVKRTGNGIGQKNLKGGSNYKEINNKSAKFFSGDRDRISIPLQYKIEKVSVTIPAHTYIVEIVYTIKAK